MSGVYSKRDEQTQIQKAVRSGCNAGMVCNDENGRGVYCDTWDYADSGSQ